MRVRFLILPQMAFKQRKWEKSSSCFPGTPFRFQGKWNQDSLLTGLGWFNPFPDDWHFLLKRVQGLELQECFHECWRWTGNPTGTSISTFPKLNLSPLPHHQNCSSSCIPGLLQGTATPFLSHSQHADRLSLHPGWVLGANIPSHQAVSTWPPLLPFFLFYSISLSLGPCSFCLDVCNCLNWAPCFQSFPLLTLEYWPKNDLVKLQI